MNTIVKTVFAAALLLSAAPVLAEESHHPATTTDAPATSPAPETAAPQAPTPGGMPGGMMGGDMMKMMQEMMGRQPGMMQGMMGGGVMGQMMSPEHVEGRIAFLKAELQVTDAQQPLWDALAEAIRANAGAASEMMSGAQGGMAMGSKGSTAPQRVEAQERALSARLDSLRRLKAALDPFYAALDAAQREKADKLLVPAPMGMM